MIREVLDDKKFRVTFALLVGIPATLACLIALPYAIVFGLVAITHLQPLFVIIGIAAILGTFGIIGAWFRVIKTRENLSDKLLFFTRTSLACGIASTLLLFGVATWTDSFLTVGLPLLVVLGVGVVFYVGT